MFGYIYETTNIQNGSKYIGQHHGEFNPAYLGSGLTMLKAIKRYGRDAFKVVMLVVANNQIELDALEIEHIASARQAGYRLYNIWDGGTGKPAGWKATLETLHRMSLSQRGKRHSAETRRKMRESQKKFNSLRSPESNKKRSDKLKGRIITPEWRRKISEGHQKRKIQNHDNNNTDSTNP